MSLQSFHVTRQTFEAARQLSNLAAHHPASRLHGHGFELVAVANGQYDADALDQDVSQLCHALDYQDLNARLGEVADDRVILKWFATQLNHSALVRLTLKSAPNTLTRQLPHRADGLTVAQWFYFEAAHQLPNVPAGHKCGRMHGHGFGVKIECLVGPDRFPEQVREDIDAAWAVVAPSLHLACLNDIKGLENPTSEHLALWLWNQLTNLGSLKSIGVNETPSAGCVFNGHQMRIWKQQTLDAAVQLVKAPEGDPRRCIHGHTFNVRLHLTGPLDEVLGWVYDFGDVKTAFRPVFDELDHHPLYTIKGLEHADDLTLAQYIHNQMRVTLPALSGVDVEHRPHQGAWLVQAGTRHGL